MSGKSNRTICVSVAFITGLLFGVIMPSTFLLFVACIVCIIIGASIIFGC
ncbi:MAG: hypothetical protein IKU84_01515 [Clostridia bacterium]|nr:hypothetical protein [Clostridia bacterium]